MANTFKSGLLQTNARILNILYIISSFSVIAIGFSSTIDKPIIKEIIMKNSFYSKKKKGMLYFKFTFCFKKHLPSGLNFSNLFFV